MKRTLVAAVFLFAVCLQLATGNNSHQKIKHVVVLMLENRSFDHMLGYMKSDTFQIDGLNGDERCPVDPQNPNRGNVPVNDEAEYVDDADPGHSLESTSRQIYGKYNADDKYDTSESMNGFVLDAMMHNTSWRKAPMTCFNPSKIPALTTLAREFAVFDRWFSSVPGPTEMNRLYLHSATSRGDITHDNQKFARGYPQKTIFQSLEDAGVSWNVYMEPTTTTIFFNQMRRPPFLNGLKFFDDFEDDVKSGKLASYAFIEPAYFSAGADRQATDQHPGHDVGLGDLLVKKIYETLRKSDLWNSTAFLITYDEHGGYYDHVAPPTGVPNPDGKNCSNPKFDFTRLGVRVPTVLVSPWVRRGRIVNRLGSGEFEHSSVPATLKKLFGLESFLTRRDAWASTFESLFDEVDQPRQDCPHELPAANTTGSVVWDRPLNDLQKGLLSDAGILNGGLPRARQLLQGANCESVGVSCDVACLLIRQFDWLKREIKFFQRFGWRNN